MGKIYFLLGKNNLLIEEKLQELSSKNLRLIFNKDSKGFFLDLQRNLNQRLTGENYDLVIKITEKLKDSEIKKLILILTNPKPNIFFICQTEPTELIYFFQKNKVKVEVIRIRVPERKELKDFTIQFLRKKGLNFSPSIIDFLVNNYADNLDLLIQDLNKISQLKSDEALKNFKYLLSLLTNNFKIHDLFLERNWPDFIHNFKKFILEDKSKDKIETLRLLTFLSNSLTKILLLKQAKKITKGHPFYLQKLKEKGEKLKIEEIKRLQAALAKTERKFKKHYLNLKDIPEDIYLNYLLLEG